MYTVKTDQWFSCGHVYTQITLYITQISKLWIPAPKFQVYDIPLDNSQGRETTLTTLNNYEKSENFEIKLYNTLRNYNAYLESAKEMS